MENNPFFEKQEIKSKKGSLIIKFLEFFVVFSSLFIVFYLFIFTPNQVYGPSMLPNFEDKQLVVTSRLSQYIGSSSLGKALGLDYKRGDIIIFKDPEQNKLVIKRIIGLPGERVALRNGSFYIDNKEVIETDYLDSTVFTKSGDLLEDGGESVFVEKGTFFVAGDNRAVSRDSRYKSIGLVERSEINGKVILRFFPLNSFGIISGGKITFKD